MPRQLTVLGPESLQVSLTPPGSVMGGGAAAAAASGKKKAPIARSSSRILLSGLGSHVRALSAILKPWRGTGFVDQRRPCDRTVAKVFVARAQFAFLVSCFTYLPLLFLVGVIIATRILLLVLYTIKGGRHVNWQPTPRAKRAAAV
jgi:hypothetical protein